MRRRSAGDKKRQELANIGLTLIWLDERSNEIDRYKPPAVSLPGGRMAIPLEAQSLEIELELQNRQISLLPPKGQYVIMYRSEDDIWAATVVDRSFLRDASEPGLSIMEMLDDKVQVLRDGNVSMNQE